MARKKHGAEQIVAILRQIEGANLTSTTWRLFAQVDCRREMRPTAFLDPRAFLGTDLWITSSKS